MTNLWVTLVLSGEWGHCHRGAECGGARVFTASDHNKSSSLRRVLTPIEAVKVRAGRAAPSALLLLLAAYYPQCSYETSSPDKTHGSLPAPARRPATARQPAEDRSLYNIQSSERKGFVFILIALYKVRHFLHKATNIVTSFFAMFSIDMLSKLCTRI